MRSVTERSETLLTVCVPCACRSTWLQRSRAPSNIKHRSSAVAQRSVGNSRFAIALIPLAVLSCSASAEVFNVTATLDGETRTASFNTVEQAIDVFSDAGLQELVTAYDGTQMVNVQL